MAYVIEDLNGEEIVGTFYEKKLQKKNNKEFKNKKKIKKSKRIEKVIKKKGDKFYIKWENYDNSFLTVKYFPKMKPLWGNVKVELNQI